MKTSHRLPAHARVLLLQLRGQPEVEQQERRCFVAHLGADPQQLHCVNMLERPLPRVADAIAFDLVILGGAGDHSASRAQNSASDSIPDAISHPLTDLLGEIVERGRRFFGACFGHQYLARALGGEVDAAVQEVGTFDIQVSAAGTQDPLLRDLPKSFPAHLGHHDGIAVMPSRLITLASSPRCKHQMVRIPNQPIYGAQFHCEMTVADMEARLARQGNYHLGAPLRETPHANGILARFVDEYLA